MDLTDLGAPAALWRRWCLLAAGHAALGDVRVEIRAQDGCAHVGDGAGGWLRMRRAVGDRAVVWGHHPTIRSGPAYDEEVLDAAPDWSVETDSAHVLREIGFFGWHAHAQWWSVPALVPHPVARMLGPLLDDEALARWWTTHLSDHEAALAEALGDPVDEGALLALTDPARVAELVGRETTGPAMGQLDRGAGWSRRRLSDTATAHLRSTIHAQMQGARELGHRGHPRRPVLLRQWAKIHGGAPFRHAVCALGTAHEAFVAGAANEGLAEHQVLALENVLLELRDAETDPASGAWLFALVSSDGRTVTLDRAYDSWPGWYAAGPAGLGLHGGSGPTMAALHAEMSERKPAWRPPWAALLPADRF